MSVLELSHVSPRLLEASDLELAVPGTYQAREIAREIARLPRSARQRTHGVPRQAGAPVVSIRSFARSMTVISSKQRPRKLVIRGSDGTDHLFLLKGHEDLRQDERVMQLFGLVNTLLSTDRHVSNKDLAIQRYSVRALRENRGPSPEIGPHEITRGRAPSPRR